MMKKMPFKVLCFLGLTFPLWAVPTVPNQFSNGQVADADQMNENFSAVFDLLKPYLEPQIKGISSGGNFFKGFPAEITSETDGRFLNYEWNFNGAPLGENGTTVEIPSANISHAGEYSLTVSNDFGTVTSDNVLIDVLEEFHIGSLDLTELQSLDYTSDAGSYRSGIAVSQNYVYVNGSSNTVRYDLDLLNPVLFPVSDGLFSTPDDGRLYSIGQSTGAFDLPISGYAQVTHLFELNENLQQISSIVLSTPIDMYGDYDNGLFSSGNSVYLNDSYNNYLYSIDLTSGVTSDAMYTSLMVSPNGWASRGVVENNGIEETILYHSSYDGFLRYFIQSDENSSDDVVDMNKLYNMYLNLESYAIAPWVQRYYFSLPDDDTGDPMVYFGKMKPKEIGVFNYNPLIQGEN